MISLLTMILAVWGGVYAENVLLAFSGVSLYIIFFLLMMDKLEFVKILLLVAIVGSVLDIAQFLPIGTHLVIAGMAYLVYKFGTKSNVDDWSLSSSLFIFTSFVIYYLFSTLSHFWAESGFAFGYLTWGIIWKVIGSSIVSLFILGITRYFTQWAATSSPTNLHIRK